MRKYKTIAGYLRAVEQGLYNVEPGSEAERAHERRTINILLPQIGVAETIADTEMPRDGIDRIQKLATNPAHIKALATCRKWLCRPRIIGVSTGAVRVS